MSPSVLAGLAGVLVAAAATGMLARQCVRGPQAGVVLWTAAGLALVVALLAQIAGFATGFTPVTFRAVQLGAQFAAPLWLAWGLLEVAGFGGTVRFGVRLASGAITLVAGIIVGTDPLTAAPFTKSWPPDSVHFQFVAHDVLLFTQVVAVLMALTAAGTATFRARAGSASTGPGPRGAGYGPEVSGSAAAAVAVIVATSLRFALPVNPGYPLLCGLAAALAWFAMTKVRETRSEPSAAVQGQRARRYESDDPAYVPVDKTAMRGWRGRNRDAWDQPRRDRRDRRGGRDDQDWYQPGQGDPGYQDEGHRGQGYGDRGYGYARDARSGHQQPGYGGYQADGYGQAGYGGDYGHGPGNDGPARYDGASRERASRERASRRGGRSRGGWPRRSRPRRSRSRGGQPRRSRSRGGWPRRHQPGGNRPRKYQPGGGRSRRGQPRGGQPRRGLV